jgi:beta-glucanase (GH16 family)
MKIRSYSLLKVFALIACGIIPICSQTKTNLDVFKVLVDSSLSEALLNLSDSQKDIYVDLKLTSAYSVFENQIFKSIQAQKKNIATTSSTLENIRLSYSIENAAVNYGEVFRDGFLGNHFVDRKIYITGSYLINSEEMSVKDFYFESIDTVEFDEIQTLENSSYPFTQGEIPTEPFLSNLFEPLVALTTAAVVIALFFTIRSK